MTDYLCILNDQLFLSIDELKEKGLSHYKINQLVNQGLLTKINRKYYQNESYEGEISDFYCVPAYVSNGIICLVSAASYYNLTSIRLNVIDVAVPRKARISTLPDWPELKLYYFTDQRYYNGIRNIKEGKNHYKIYDIEKTVADIVFYREKVGIEEMKEILVKYLERKDRNINRLVHFSELLKCKNVLQQYLEVLV